MTNKDLTFNLSLTEALQMRAALEFAWRNNGQIAAINGMQ